jgi:phospholipid/cholesterol/gamma-HCH transport system ATP-binding protein
MTCVKNISDVVVLLLNGMCYIEGTYRELEKSTDQQIKQFFE